MLILRMTFIPIITVDGAGEIPHLDDDKRLRQLIHGFSSPRNRRRSLRSSRPSHKSKSHAESHAWMGIRPQSA
jgi:hypothetical protein